VRAAQMTGGRPTFVSTPFTCGEQEDWQEALDVFWALVTGPFGPKDWPSE
jgi:hypothetical protein